MFLRTTHTLLSLSCHRQVPEGLWKDNSTIDTIDTIELIDTHTHATPDTFWGAQEYISLTDQNIPENWLIAETTPSLSISSPEYMAWNPESISPKHLSSWKESHVEILLTSSCLGEMWWKANEMIYGIPNNSTFRKIGKQPDNTWRIFIPVYRSVQHLHLQVLCTNPQHQPPTDVSSTDILWQETIHTYRKDTRNLPFAQIVQNANQIELLLANSVGATLRVYQQRRVAMEPTESPTEYSSTLPWTLVYEQAIYEQIQHSEFTTPSTTTPTEFRIEIDHGDWSQIQDIPIQSDVSFLIPTGIYKKEEAWVQITTNFQRPQQGTLRILTSQNTTEKPISVSTHTDLHIIATEPGLHTIELEINEKIYRDFFWVEFDRLPMFTQLVPQKRMQWISHTQAWKQYVHMYHVWNTDIEEKNTWTATSYTTTDTLDITQKPPFLRLGDSIAIREYLLDPTISNSLQSTVHHTWVHATTLGTEQTPIPVILSPNDTLIYQPQYAFLSNSSVQHKLPIEVPTRPTYFTSDDQYSEQLLSVFFTHLFEAHSIENDALYVYALSTIWNNIANRRTPWHDTLLERYRKDRDFLISRIQEEKTTEQDIISIAWALLAATRAGIMIPSISMSKLLPHLCSCAESIETKHLQWMLANSYWKHRKCGEGISVFANPQTKPMLDGWKYSLESRLRHKEIISTPYQDTDQKPHWGLFVWWDILEQTHHRYNNFSLTLQHNQETIVSGLFHTWQNRNIATTISTNTTLQATGLGRLYWSLWQIIPTQRSTKDPLPIERRMVDINNKDIDIHNITLGSKIKIQYTIHSLPNQDILVETFPTAGFSHATTQMRSITVHTNEHGIAQWNENVVALFVGRFSFPAPQFIVLSNNMTDTIHNTLHLGTDEIIEINTIHPQQLQ